MFLSRFWGNGEGRKENFNPQKCDCSSSHLKTGLQKNSAFIKDLFLVLVVSMNKPERGFGLQVRCRKLDIFKILEIFWIFWGEFLSRIFLGIFFGGIFWRYFLGGFFLEDVFGRIFLAGILGRNYLVDFLQGIDVFVKILG